MNVIVLEIDPASDKGGKSLSMFDVCQRLADKGHHIFLLYVNEGDLLEKYRQFCVQVLPLKNIRIHKEKTLKSLSEFARQILYICFNLKLEKQKKTLIYFDNYLCCSFAIALSSVLQKPSILHIRLGLSSEIVFHQQDRFAIRQTKQFLSVSENTKQHWSQEFGLARDRIQTIYNGIDPDCFYPVGDLRAAKEKLGLHSQTTVVTYAGRLDPEKGLETLIRAIALWIKQGRDNIQLLIVGKPIGYARLEEAKRYEAYLKQLPIELEIDDQVRFLNYTTDTLSLYHASDLTVLPSLYPEPFGRTIIESMACGVPALASCTGGIPEILTGRFKNFLFQPGDEFSLLERFLMLEKWREADSKLGTECRDHIKQNFDICKTVDHIERLMIEL